MPSSHSLKHIKKHTTKIIATLIIVFALFFMFNNGGNKMQDNKLKGIGLLENEKKGEIWKRVLYFLCGPTVIGLLAFRLYKQHQENKGLKADYYRYL